MKNSRAFGEASLVRMRELRRAGRFLVNLFRSREAIALDEQRKLQATLEILLRTHGGVLRDEERARAEELLLETAKEAVDT